MKSVSSHLHLCFHAGSVPRVSPPSGTVALNRTSSVNLTCLVTGQAGARVEWYKNRQRLLRPPFSPIRSIRYGNGSVESVLTLSKVKYRDRGTIMSCSAWYPSLAINSTRNVLLLVHGKLTEDLPVWLTILYAVILLFLKSIYTYDVNAWNTCILTADWNECVRSSHFLTQPN